MKVFTGNSNKKPGHLTQTGLSFPIIPTLEAMFHLLSKVLLIFIFPLSWVLILLVLALLVKRPALRKRLLTASIIVLLIFSNDFLINQFARLWDIRTLPPAGTHYRCGILLGGFASEGPGDNGHFNGTADRFIQALKLLDDKRISKLAITGGNGTLRRTKWAEADFAAQQLREFKIPDSLLLVENKSRNTLENVLFTRELLRTREVPGPYLLITSAFHMRRALQTFRSVGLDVVAYPCDFRTSLIETRPGDFLPGSEALYNWGTYIKEVVGYAVYRLKLALITLK